MKKLLFLFTLILASAACKKETNSTIDCGGLYATKRNILLVIADDMRLDASPGYSIGSVKPAMPNLQAMINSGVRYNNFWTYPVCTPTRSSIITGKHGFRTNIYNVGDDLSTSETSCKLT